MDSMSHRARLSSATLGVLLVLGSVLPHADAATPRIGPNGQGTLYVVGDSLTFGADYFDKMQSKIQSLGTWPKVVVDAKDGRKATVGARILKDKVRTNPEITAVVVALGTNDMISHSETTYPDKAIDAVMTAAAGRPVLWMNLRFNSTPRPDWRIRGIRFNKALVRAQTRWPNLSVADWSTWFVPSGKVRYISDGVHLTVSGYRARSGWLVLQLRSFGSRIVDSSTTTTTSTTSSSTSVAPTTTATSTPSTTTAPASTSAPTTTTVPPGMGQS